MNTPNQIDISIIIPIYNVEKYLTVCIDSLMNQGDLRMEIILINDGSTDLSGEIADEYAKKEERIKVIHQENGGASAARNVGLDIATGEYIAFLDSDDYVDSRWIIISFIWWGGETSCRCRDGKYVAMSSRRKYG